MKARAHKKCAHHRVLPFAGILNVLLQLSHKLATRHAEPQSMKIRAHKKHRYS